MISGEVKVDVVLVPLLSSVHYSGTFINNFKKGFSLWIGDTAVAQQKNYMLKVNNGKH